MSLSEISLIGCRISIISKAQIRYEGFLHSVDCDTPNEPVITLSKVWSFGTEDRPCERPVAPRNEEYNQVVFRGRDLEDVRLVQSSVFLNEDSAIVSAAPGVCFAFSYQFVQSGISQTTPVHPSEPKREDNRSHDRLSLLTGTTDGSASASQPVSLDGLNQQINRPTPLAFHQSAVGTRPGPIGTLQPDSTQSSDTRGPRPFGDGRSDGDMGALPSSRKLDFFTRLTSANPPEDPGRQRTVLGSSPHFDSPQNWGNRDANTRGSANVAGTMFRGASAHFPQNTVSDQDGFRPRRGGFNNQWVGNPRGMRYPQSAYHRRGPRQGGNFRCSRMHAGMPGIPNEPTFSGEYDYEKANAELAVELEKISISVKSNSSVDGDANKEESGDSATGEDSVCYNQSKSFFDTLSSEMMDKANGVNPQGMNRRDERLLNSATFGTTGTQLPRRGGYGHHRYNYAGGFSGYNYGQRRPNSGGYWRPGGNNNASRNTVNHGAPLSAASNAT
ncbi:hypothetical protein D915_007225 [Fasciola hepatica]|uniref:FFD and TFG box motif protein n=1 Tax=Fasciola hepatica TaxID=6192 RepID=A0A4E0R5Q2_FASHE|nr:hypothetical protein D915_007225 [Fasciola hepatica]